MFKDLDPLLHSQLRLMIISYLISNTETDFNELKKITGATSGNLSVQLKKLEEADYIKITKGFLGNYQNTNVKISDTGIKAFSAYAEALKGYLN